MPGVAAVALLVAAAACGGEGAGEAPEGALVDTVHVRTMDVPSTIAASGTVEADNETAVAAEVGGRVARIVRDEGTPVRAGDAVVQLDTGDHRDEVQAAEAELSRARATLTADERLFERYGRLLEAGAIDPQTYEDLEARVESGKAAVAQAGARLASARRDLGRTTVRAPFAGTVGKRHVQLGEYVDAQQAVFDLVDAQPVRIRFSIAEIHAGEVDLGDRIRFRVRSDTVSARVAEVHYVSPAIDPQTRTFEVTATYSNPDLAIRPGAYADVVLTSRIHENAPVVPEEALYTEGTENYVFVVAGGTASRRRVEVGSRFEGLVEILEGVEAGEAVITAGQHGLADGAPVRVSPREEERLERRG